MMINLNLYPQTPQNPDPTLPLRLFVVCRAPGLFAILSYRLTSFCYDPAHAVHALGVALKKSLFQ
jgi:hypothetical protein